MQDNAVTPDKSAILDVVKQMKASEKTEEAKVNPKDSAYYEMSKTSGWKNLKRYVEKRKLKLMHLLDDSVADKPLAEIGTKYLMVRQIVTELDNLIRTVERSEKFVEGVEDANKATSNK